MNYIEDYFSLETKQLIERCVKLQKIINALNFQNIDESVNKIKKKDLFKFKNDIKIMWNIILSYIENASNKIIFLPKLIALFVCKIFQELDEEKQNIFQDILLNQKNLCESLECKVPFYFYLLKFGGIDKMKVVEFLFKYCSLKINSLFIFFFWFAPVLSNSFPKINQKIVDIIKRIQPPIGFDLFILYLDSFLNDNWKIHEKFINTGYYPGTIEAAIKNDDDKLLISIASNNNNKKIDNMHDSIDFFDWNQLIKPSILHCSYFLNQEVTLIQFAAFFGAVKCFKFLYQNGSSVIKKTVSRTIEFAAAGGNMEIIQLISEKCLIFDGSLQLTINFHRNDIFYWIFDHSDVEILKQSSTFESPLYFAIRSDNVEVLVFLLEVLYQKNEKPFIQENLLTNINNYAIYIYKEFIASIKEKEK